MSNDASSVKYRQPLAARLSDATTGIASTVMDAEKEAEKTFKSLIDWDDLPVWRRDNAFILTGYRPDSNSYWDSFTSLQYLHNESVNIWSHLIGGILFLFIGFFLHQEVVPRYESATSSDVLVFACFFSGAVTCLGMSATYHTLSNHSPAVGRVGNKLDYLGIVFLIVGSYVPALYYGFFCLPKLMTAYLSIICLLGLSCAVVSWLEHFRTPEWRPFRAAMFVSFGLSGVVPVLHGLQIHGRDYLEKHMSLSWVVTHGLMYVFGAFLYAARWPERKCPGRFDIWGSSHQIFHLFVVAAAGTHLYGMGKAFDFHHSGQGSC